MSKRKASTDAPQSAAKRTAVENGPDSSDESDKEIDQSQRPDFQTNLKEAEFGIIEKVSLKNFMCHNRLEVTFGPNVNFIIGRNGSGKSAVVTAIVVGLGGKASTTSRGSTIKSFIKTGKQTADVEIQLRNRGLDAFKHDEYGDSIKVQRKFNNDGSSQYRLKSKTGQTVSTRKDELSRLLDHFNIQVDNPVAVLNQETSKNFLNSKSPHDKYKMGISNPRDDHAEWNLGVASVPLSTVVLQFFLKATQLAQIKEDYTQASQQKQFTDEIIEQKVKTLPKLEKEVLDWEQKYKSLTAVDDLKKKVASLKNELAWAWVIDKEKGLSPLQKEIQVEESRLPRFKQKAEEVKQKFDSLSNRLKELQTLLNDSGVEVKALQPAHQEAKAAVQDQKKAARTAQMGVKQVESTLKATTKEKDDIRERIKEMQTTAQHDYAAEKQKRTEKIQDLQERVKNLQAQEQTTDHDLEQFKNAITKSKNDLYKIRQDIDAFQAHKSKRERNLQTLQSSRGNRLERFGIFMPKLIQAIETTAQLGKFHRKPIGPLGACFTLKEQKWALAIECCLKGLMNAFVCHDYHDEKLLEQLVSETCPPHFKATIIVSRYKDRVYDVSQLRAQSDRFPAIIDVIQTDNPMVANSLIDQKGIECILLIERGRDARQVMDPEGQPGPPKHATEAFTIHGDQVYSFPTFRYYSSSQDKVKFLTANVEEDITALVSEIQDLKLKINQASQQKVQLESEMQQNIAIERRTETQLMKIRETKRKYMMDINELENVEDPVPVDVSTLEEEERMLNERILDLQTERENKMAIFRECDEKLKELENNFKNIEAQMKLKIDAADNIKEEVGSVVNEIEATKGHKTHYDQKLKEQETKIKELKNNMDKYQKEIETDTEKAKKICEERINTRRKPSNLESEIEQILKQIKNQERIQGDPDEIARNYQEKKGAYFKIKKEVGDMKRFCQRLELVVNHRLQQYREFRRMIAVRAKYFFVVLLSNRQYTGKMTFNHKAETLEMFVQPANAGEGARDLKCLSGGERSFSTVCFILSLWDAIESPFRCLDEFDVFMDMVNRRISMDMMMITAEKQKDRQFIFLSPLDMSQFGISTPNMRIFRMPNPDRGQSTLPFRPEGEEEEDG